MEWPHSFCTTQSFPAYITTLRTLSAAASEMPHCKRWARRFGLHNGQRTGKWGFVQWTWKICLLYILVEGGCPWQNHWFNICRLVLVNLQQNSWAGYGGWLHYAFLCTVTSAVSRTARWHVESDSWRIQRRHVRYRRVTPMRRSWLE